MVKNCVCDYWCLFLSRNQFLMLLSLSFKLFDSLSHTHTHINTHTHTHSHTHTYGLTFVITV
ncbi:hypothetical protein HanPSC8_Chr13g0590671 [Helianthus annuus]|nr:hypothetical protein HanPSC8_Chr13g0590671 [Helianthus annuus]